jgi:hypothetical protein
LLVKFKQSFTVEPWTTPRLPQESPSDPVPGTNWPPAFAGQADLPGALASWRAASPLRGARQARLTPAASGRAFDAGELPDSAKTPAPSAGDWRSPNADRPLDRRPKSLAVEPKM